MEPNPINPPDQLTRQRREFDRAFEVALVLQSRADLPHDRMWLSTRAGQDDGQQHPVINIRTSQADLPEWADALHVPAREHEDVEGTVHTTVDTTVDDVRVSVFSLQFPSYPAPPEVSTEYGVELPDGLVVDPTTDLHRALDTRRRYEETSPRWRGAQVDERRVERGPWHPVTHPVTDPGQVGGEL